MTVTPADISRLQTRIQRLEAYAKAGDGDPNGVVDGPLAATYQRTDTGAVYRKTTPLGTLTGWVTP